MNIAYLILCHKNEKQVAELISLLNSENTDFYVHIDKKAENFNLAKSDNIFVLPEDKRVDIRWATKSMVDATMNLVHCMLESEKKYDYVFLISGQDFPVKSNVEIERYLVENSNCNFIEVLAHTDPFYKRYKKRNDIIYPIWMQKASLFAKCAKKIYIYLSGGYNRTFGLFKRKNNTQLTFEFGSQWWCLTYDCLKWITEYIDTHKNILDFFHYSLTPDECLFQTVFMNSPYKDKRCDKLTYLEWAENRNNPKILTEKDYETLKTTDCLFARKFDYIVDSKIVEMIKKLLKD